MTNQIPRCHTRHAHHQLPAFLTPPTEHDDTTGDEDVSDSPEAEPDV